MSDIAFVSVPMNMHQQTITATCYHGKCKEAVQRTTASGFCSEAATVLAKG